MKKIAFLLICLSLVSLSYGQSLVLHSTISADKKNVVDQFTAFDPATITNTAYIGTTTKTRNTNRPFQMQSFRVGGIGNSGNTGALNMSAGRDFVIADNIGNFNSATIWGGSLFSSVATTNSNTITNLNAGKARAQDIVSSLTSIELSSAAGENSTLSGSAITVNSKQITSPFEYGSLITLNNTINKNSALATTSSSGFRAHIYYPWSSLYSTISTMNTGVPTDYTNRCNGNDAPSSYNPCRHTSCSYCSSNTTGKCHDVRSVELPAVFQSNGATFNKIGSIKFYCKYDGNSCKQYYDANVGINSDEGYTLSAVPGGSIFSYATNSNIITYNTPAEKCYVMCSGACTTAGNYYVAINTDTGDVVNIGTIYEDSARCSNSRIDWPGLECQANEIDLEVYQLSCNVGSGTALRTGGTYYQYRKVDCDGSGVTGETADSNINTTAFVTVDFPKN